MGSGGAAAAVADAVRALGGLVLAPSCAGCGAPDTALCGVCRDAMAASPWSGAREVSPTPRPHGLPRTYATAPYAGPLAVCVTAYKDEARRDRAGDLAGALGVALDRALRDPAAVRVLGRDDGPVLVVPVPSSRAARRRRGDAPLERVARLAVAGYRPTEVVVAAALAPRRRVADQAGLTAAQRAVNLEWSMRVRPVWEAALVGSVCVVMDDVLTTGSTLVEAARALRGAGAAHVLGATICATQRRRAPPSGRSAAVG